MTDERKTQLRGRGLWKSLPRDPAGPKGPGAPDQPGAPITIDGRDANLLAGLLDRSLSAAERETLEARLDDDPMLLETLLAAHGGERAEAGPPPELIDAAKATGPGGGDQGGGLHLVRDHANENGRGRIAWLEWAAAAAAIVVVSTVGFQIGSDSGRRGGKTTEVAAKKSETLDLDLEGNFFATGFTLDEADDAFNGDDL